MEKYFIMSDLFDHATKLIEAYHIQLQPLCKETDLPPLALDILLFIANNPRNATAKDICRMRGLKTGIVSVHIDRLVKDGLVERKPFPGDRRKIELVYTSKADKIIEKGRAVQILFAENLLVGIDKSDLSIWTKILQTVDKNIDSIRNGN